MKLIDKNIIDFINEVDKKSATPGGGSVSALAGALGTALMRMTGHLTIHKKKFSKLSDEIQNNVMNAFSELERLKEELIRLIDLDTEAYNSVMNAYRLPKETKEEKHSRRQAIQKATIQAIESPLAMMDTTLEVMHHLHIMLEYGNQNTISDLGVASIMLYGAIQGAELNVRINLDMLHDQTLKTTYEKKAFDRIKQAKELYDFTLQHVNNVI